MIKIFSFKRRPPCLPAGRLLKLILVTAFFLLYMRVPAYAADLTITCNMNDCTKNSNTSLFTSATIWYPGLSESHTILVENTVNVPLLISTHPSTYEEMAQNLDTVLFLTISLTGNAVPIWTGTLREFFSYDESNPLSLTTVNAHTSLEFTYTVTMDLNTGNEFQDARTAFDLSFNFSGDDPSQSPSNSSGTSGSTASSGTSGATNASGTTGATGEEGSLFSGTDFQQQDIAGPTGIVAGETTDENSQPKVEGASTVLCNTCIWWPLLILQAVLTLYYYLRSKNKSRKEFLIGGIAVSIFTYAVFLFVNKDCRNGWELWISTTHFWCKYFILWVFMICGSLSFFMRPKNKE